MLIYNQVFDIYHTMFRILQIIEKTNEEIEFDRLRILDFYLVFPAELLKIHTFRGFKKYEKYLKIEINNYERILDRKRIFYKMENIQLLAIKVLISYDLIDSDKYKEGIIKRTDKKIESKLYNRIIEENDNNKNIMELITGPLVSMDLYGHLGLKERTKLIEFKYDTI